MPNLKLAFRTLFKSPFITLVAILSLALGIGANSAIFPLFDQMLLRPLPVPNPEELVNFATPGPKPGSQSCGQAGSCDEIFSYPMFRDLERAQTGFTGLAAHRPFGASLGYQGTSLGGEGLLVSGSYFPVLSVNPVLGLVGRGSKDTEFYEAVFERLIDVEPLPDTAVRVLAGNRADAILYALAKAGVDRARLKSGGITEVKADTRTGITTELALSAIPGAS